MNTQEGCEREIRGLNRDIYDLKDQIEKLREALTEILKCQSTSADWHNADQIKRIAEEALAR